MSSIARDIRFATRVAAQNGPLTVGMIVTIAIAIGAGVTVLAGTQGGRHRANRQYPGVVT